MSEEKIIKNAKDFIEYLETDLDGNDENGIEWTLFPKDLDTIKGLLDLYKKEKEKNKELEEKLKIATAMLTKGTYPEENEGDNNFDKKFIAVGKIKELLENETIDISGFRCIAVEDIENLLEGK